MMYRTYGFAMYYHQFKSLMQSPLLNSIEDPETKKAALKALVKTQIAAGLAVGSAGDDAYRHHHGCLESRKRRA